MRNKIVFYLNGIKKEISGPESSMMLADYLRYDQSLTGTKIVCAEGDCGACTVLRYFPHSPETGHETYLPINSCISLVAQLDGSSLVTVDALKQGQELHPVQKAMVECHGSQCGFCTPGFVMALTGLVEHKISQNETKMDTQEAKNCMTGNLCRCTGYQSIIDSAVKIDLTKCTPIKELFYDEEQSSILQKIFDEEVLIKTDSFSFYAPKTLDDAVSYLEKNSEVRIIGSATDLGVVHNKRKINLDNLLSLHLISDLYKISQIGDDVTLGARVTLSECRHFLKDRLPELSKYLNIFASPQIKNLGTVIGNIANASPIGDMPPPLLVLNSVLCLMGKQGKREIPLTDFFIGPKKTALQKAEIITHVRFKLPHKNTSLKFYKYSNRKDMDISSVNLAFRIDWRNKDKKEISQVAIALGGVAATPIRMSKTEQFLQNNFDLEGAIKVLHTEFSPISDLRASSAYRHVLVENYMRHFFEEIT